MKKEMQTSALTLQKHVRGWLTRRRFKLLREKQMREQAEQQRLEKERRNARNMNIKQIFGRAALLQKLASEEKQDDGNDKENKAAVIIQSCEYFY
jgi:myosin-3